MLVEERVYVLQPEASPAMYFEAYKRTGGLELQTRILGQLLGFFTTEVGELNSVVHLWGYESFEERSRRRALLAVEPVWQAYLSEVKPMLKSMSNRILVPADFSPIR
jgi:hypothetical protein